MLEFPRTDWADAARNSAALQVHLLGSVDFESFLRVQECLASEIAARTDRRGILLVCEHPPVITIGRNGSLADILVEDRELRSRKLTIRQISRGGGTMLHGPGQLALYPLLPLDRLKTTVAAYRQCLAEAALKTAQELEIPAELTTTPWGAAGRYGQFALVGASVRSWISHFGLYLNVSLPAATLSPVHWGIESERLTSLSALRMRPIGMAQARESVIRHLAGLLGYEQFHLHTGHPLLRPVRRPTYVHTEV